MRALRRVMASSLPLRTDKSRSRGMKTALAKYPAKAGSPRIRIGRIDWPMSLINWINVFSSRLCVSRSNASDDEYEIGKSARNGRMRPDRRRDRIISRRAPAANTSIGGSRYARWFIWLVRIVSGDVAVPLPFEPRRLNDPLN